MKSNVAMNMRMDYAKCTVSKLRFWKMDVYTFRTINFEFSTFISDLIIKTRL